MESDCPAAAAVVNSSIFVRSSRFVRKKRIGCDGFRLVWISNVGCGCVDGGCVDGSGADGSGADGSDADGGCVNNACVAIGSTIGNNGCVDISCLPCFLHEVFNTISCFDRRASSSVEGRRDAIEDRNVLVVWRQKSF